MGPFSDPSTIWEKASRKARERGEKDPRGYVRTYVFTYVRTYVGIGGERGGGCEDGFGYGDLGEGEGTVFMAQRRMDQKRHDCAQFEGGRRPKVHKQSALLRLRLAISVGIYDLRA